MKPIADHPRLSIYNYIANSEDSVYAPTGGAQETNIHTYIQEMSSFHCPNASSGLYGSRLGSYLVLGFLYISVLSIRTHFYHLCHKRSCVRLTYVLHYHQARSMKWRCQYGDLEFINMIAAFSS